MLREGAKLDRYRIEVELGAGGMGRVYRAFDERLHRHVALKVLLTPSEEGGPDANTQVADTQAFGRVDSVTRLLREARAVAALSHPNVVAVFDVGEAEGMPYIAMEFVAGRSLAAYVGDPSVPMQDRLRWLADAARALGAAHRAGIVHRDVKPANVLVRDDGTVKVLDFGIARWSAPDAPPRSASGAISYVSGAKILGTPYYMAPEQIRGEEVDGRTDQFGWGVMAYELLAGKTPWQASGALSAIGMILSREPTPLHEVAPGVPQPVEAAVMRAFRKEASERFASMDDLVAELEPWLAPVRTPSGAPLSARTAARLDAPTQDVPPGTPRSNAPGTPRSNAPGAPRSNAPGTPRVGEPGGLLLRSGAPALMPAALHENDPALTLHANDPAFTLHANDPALTLRASDPGLAPAGPSNSDPTPAGAGARESPPASGELSPNPPPGSSDTGRASQPTSQATPGTPRSVWPHRVPAGARWLPALGAVLGVLAVAAVLIVALRRGGDVAPPPRVAPAGGPATTRIIDLPPPGGCTPQATDTYAEALRLMREGDYEQAVRRFQAAADADPGCAGAQMRLAVTGQFFLPPERALEAFQRAIQLRRNLSERDQGLLDVYEPLMLRDPPDRDESSTRLLRLLERFPDDAELLVLAASESRATDEERLAFAQRAVRIDPQQSDAWQNLGKLLAMLDRRGEAIAALEQCLKVAPLSTDCLWQRIELFRADGQCSAMEADARRMIARSPGTSQGHAMLAAALAAEGVPGETVGEVLQQRWARLPAQERAEEQASDEIKLAALTGALDRADERARGLEQLVQGSTDLTERVRAIRFAIDIRLETGREAEAERLAEDFARRRRAWTRRMDTLASLHRDDFYGEIRLLSLSRDAGALGPAAWREEIERWRDQARSSMKRADEPTFWTVTSAMPARDAAEAAEALAAFPGGLPPAGSPPARFASPGFPYAFTGRALLLAGRAAEAAPYLRRAVASCTALDHPFLHLQARLWLGQALERAGDKPGACGAYGEVLKRWGEAKPRSVTAEEARRRAKAIGCEPAK